MIKTNSMQVTPTATGTAEPTENKAERSSTENADETALPLNWSELQDEYGRTYFYNSVSGASSWYRPTGDSEEVIVGDWLQQFDENGNEYWVNQVSGESAWELPGQESQQDDDDDDGDVAASSSAMGAGAYSIEL
jgi:hypothetical protein